MSYELNTTAVRGETLIYGLKAGTNNKIVPLSVNADGGIGTTSSASADYFTNSRTYDVITNDLDDNTFETGVDYTFYPNNMMIQNFTDTVIWYKINDASASIPLKPDMARELKGLKLEKIQIAGALDGGSLPSSGDVIIELW